MSDGLEPTISGTAGPRVQVRPLAQGDLVGRYVVLGSLGAGAMGIVHLAYDPELDRRIALKLLHSRPEEPGGSAGAERTRLLREAQAMAKLAHPNVVTVHDVGQHEGTVFLAMELIEGCTLKAWLARRPRRPWRETVDVLIRAGRGLAAAHRVGLVHRDFKPDNVMVGLVGDRIDRVVVMDFGLARPESNESNESPVSTMELSAPKVPALASELTADGAIVGTPAYMPIEQLAGRRTDGRSDQFAFCVTLYEALYGQRPFVGNDLAALTYAIVEGRLEDPPADARVPRWIHRVIERGLQSEPDDRFPTMDDLLAALARDPGRRVRAWIAAGCAVAIAGGAYATTRVLDERALRRCRNEAESIRTIWNTGSEARIAEAFSGLRAEWAPEAWRRSADNIDDYVTQWIDARERVCLDATVHRSISAELERSTVRCLDERADQLSVLLEALRQVDIGTAAASIASSATLGLIEPCLDAELVVRTYGREPGGPDAIRMRRQRQRVVVMSALSRPVDTRVTALAVQAEATALGLHEIAIQAQLDAADAAVDVPDYAAAEEESWAAYRAATALGRDDLALRAVGLHAYVLGYLQSRPAEGMRSVQIGEALLERLSLRDTTEESQFLLSIAGVHAGAGRLDEARVLVERALEILRRVVGDGHPHVARVAGQLATILSAQGEESEARAAYLAALEATRTAYGAEHPLMCEALNDLAGMHVRYGKFTEARKWVEEALALYRRSGTDEAMLAGIEINFGAVERNMGRTEAAIVHYEIALGIYRRILAPQSAAIGDVLTNLGVAYSDIGDDAKALEHHREAVAAYEASYGLEHHRTLAATLNMGTALSGVGKRDEARAAYERVIEVAARVEAGDEVAGVALTNLATHYAAAGEHARALELAERSLEVKERIRGKSHPSVAVALLLVAQQKRALGDANVHDLLERALAIMEADGLPSDRGNVRFELAKVIAEQEPARARELAEKARDDYAATGKATARELAEVEAWLAGR